MIQRIQSLYLLLVFLLSTMMLLLNPNFAKFINTKAEKISSELHFITKNYYNQADPGGQPYDKLNFFILLSMGIGSVYAIFLYKKTELQKKICLYVSLMSVVLLSSLIFDFLKMSQDAPDISSYPSIHGIWPFACAVLSALAWAAIRRDEKLLKSMDR
ncbi:MAG: DUF4293 family protein, partial [Sphingomonadales bacterium]|nr:DUF4293 family protein [Sphingomonadales bacterium]